LPRQSPTLPQGLEGGTPPPSASKFSSEKFFLPKQLSCFPTISVTEPRKTNKSACKQQGRPSRGTPTPPRYGYLTRHLPRKTTLTPGYGYLTTSLSLSISLSPSRTLVTPYCKRIHSGAGQHEAAGFSPLCSVSRQPIWAGARSDNLHVGPGTPRGRNADTA
jgi:hypothetical protein